jgi:hypothetical protein
MRPETSTEDKKPTDTKMKKIEVDPDTRIQFAASKPTNDKKLRK